MSVQNAATIEVHITATFNANTYDLGTVDVTDTNGAAQVAAALRAIAEALNTPEPQRPRPDGPTRMES